MPWACSACPPPDPNPAGRKAIAVPDGNRNLVSVRSLDPPGQERTYNDSYTHFGWSADSSALVLVKDGGSYQIRAAGTGSCRYLENRAPWNNANPPNHVHRWWNAY